MSLPQNSPFFNRKDALFLNNLQFYQNHRRWSITVSAPYINHEISHRMAVAIRFNSAKSTSVSPFSILMSADCVIPTRLANSLCESFAFFLSSSILFPKFSPCIYPNHINSIWWKLYGFMADFVALCQGSVLPDCNLKKQKIGNISLKIGSQVLKTQKTRRFFKFQKFDARAVT